VQTRPVEEIKQRFGVELSSQTPIPPNYNVAPGQQVLIVSHSGIKELRACRWGFLPSWAKDPSPGNRMINARAETVAEKPAFRQAFKKGRCLVVADGFYEWQSKGGKKYPLFIRLASAETFGFAGLYSFRHSVRGDTICTCTIITIEANTLIKPFHDRMPVIVAKDREDSWLDPSIEAGDRLLPLLNPYPADEMELYPVSSRMNSPAYNHPDNVVPLPFMQAP